MAATSDVSCAPRGDELSLCSPELLEWVGERADEVERGGLLTEEHLTALGEAGCFRVAVPAAYDGSDLGLTEVLSLVQALARADGSVGWAVGQVALSQVMLGYLPDPALEQIYANGPDLIAAGAAAPKGRVSGVDGAWRVSGQWPLVSGARLAAWIFLQCLVVQDGAVQSTPEGMPRMRMVALPATAVSVLPTWDAVGLRGTGSDDVRVHGAICPEGFSCELATAALPRAAVARIPPPAQGGLFVGAAVLGIAHGALGALSDLARGGKRPAFSPRRLAEDPLFQDRFGEAQMTLEAARALLFGEVARAEALAAHGRLQTLDRARLRCAGAKAIELAVSVVDTAYTLAGGSAVYARSPLQRRLRDAHTATQHFTAGRDFYAPLGAILVEEPFNPTLT